MYVFPETLGPWQVTAPLRSAGPDLCEARVTVDGETLTAVLVTFDPDTGAGMWLAGTARPDAVDVDGGARRGVPLSELYTGPVRRLELDGAGGVVETVHPDVIAARPDAARIIS